MNEETDQTNPEDARRPDGVAPAIVRLVRDEGGRLLVAPPATQASAGSYLFDPFPFPRLPLSMHCWLTGLGVEFRRRHARCLAALLVLDCRAERWVAPVVPAQACGADGACWTLDLGAEERLPAHWLIGGSFQMRVARDVMEAVASVPEIDGAHVVQGVSDEGPQSVAYCFLRESGVSEAAAVPPKELLVDDWAMALAEASERMTFE